MQPAVKVAIATGLFAVEHSALASRCAKSVASVKFPQGRKLYRVTYNAQAVLTFGALVWYVSRQPAVTIYRVRGAAAAAMRVGQFAGVAFAAAAAHATGIATLAGLEALHGRQEPAAQGPEAGDAGELRVTGPFKLVRHPLNLAPLAPFWLAPHMTTRRLAFNVVATAYLIAGSLHEEARLRSQYGDAYARYQSSGVPFYFPRLRTSITSTATTDTSPSSTARPARP